MERDDDKGKENHEQYLLEKTGLTSVADLTALTKLDLPSCDLSELPSDLPHILPNLSILFCPKNHFRELPQIIGKCPILQMVSFKDNGMKSIHPESLQPQLRWLILTGNNIACLPETIGRCKKLQKLMLSGNSLTTLPKSIVELSNLELIRLACNKLSEPPVDLLRLPNLRWVALAQNPFTLGMTEKCKTDDLVALEDVILEDSKWPVLGAGAGGVIRKVTWNDKNVAVKTFAGVLTSDGSPQDEKAISVAAASLKDSSLIHLLGQTKNTGSLVMEFLDGYVALAGPPSMESCSRDVYGDLKLTPDFAWDIAKNLLRVLKKLHVEKSICHGDFYGHNILISSELQSVKLSDFGAAFFYDDGSEYGKLLQVVELRAYTVLVEELFNLVSGDLTDDDERARWTHLTQTINESPLSFDILLQCFT